MRPSTTLTDCWMFCDLNCFRKYRSLAASLAEKWSNLSWRPQENVPQMIVREEELFTELQVSLRRARSMATTIFGSDDLTWKRRNKRATAPGPKEVPQTEDGNEPKEGGSSPQASATGGSPGGRAQRQAPSIIPGMEMEASLAGFFEDELRGYRLLKACHLGYQERQQVLTLTGNSSGFQALRSLYNEGMAESANRRHRHPTWWAGEFEGPYWGIAWLY